MALTTSKRKRASVSYKEPTTDETSSELSGSDTRRSERTANPPRRSARHAAGQHPANPQRRYRRSTGSQRQPQLNGQSSGKRASTRFSTRKRAAISYRDSSSDENSDPQSDDEVDANQRLDAREKPLPKRGPTHKRAKLPQRHTRRTTIGAPRKPKSHSPVRTLAIGVPSDGVVPLWDTLPYLVLTKIFSFASYPVHSDFLLDPSIKWLAQSARICWAWNRPALDVLYKTLPLTSIRHQRTELVHRLISPPGVEPGVPNVFVRRLDLESRNMSHITDPTSSITDLGALILSLPALRDIDIYDSTDGPPYRTKDPRPRRWHYPLELFDVLQRSKVKLRSWRWNSDLFHPSLFPDGGFLAMKDIHTCGAFQSIQELVLVKFRREDDDEDIRGLEFRDDDAEYEASDGPSVEELLSSALAALPNLHALTFKSSTLVSGRLFPLLPQGLTCLRLDNCSRVRSPALGQFLRSHGASLEELVLNHNRALQLSFLLDLKRSCPELKTLQIDLNCFSTYANTTESEPWYREVLKEGDVPTWPSKLEKINIEYIRKWAAKTAEEFFNSLIDAAGDLPFLRELVISAIVDINWRDRATFRKDWTRKFERVFLRRSPPPAKHLMSLRAYRLWKAGQEESEKARKSTAEEAEAKHDSFVELENNDARDEEEDDSDIPLIKLPNRAKPKAETEKWNSTRLRTRARTSEPEPSPVPSREDEEYDAQNERGLHIQGGCEKVVFRLDNIRPREEMFDENDFLDSEASGDADWDGDADEVDDYAW